MNRAYPKFSNEDVKRIASSLPASSKPQRVLALGYILRLWSRAELAEHLSRKSLTSKWKQSNQTLAKVEKHAQKLLQEIEALDGYSYTRISLALAGVGQQQPLITRQLEEGRKRVAEGLTFLKTISTLTSKAKRGHPRNITAYLVMLDAAAIYEWVSGKKATREVSRLTNKETGPFRKFLEALWPVVFGIGILGLGAAMRRWGEARIKYNEKSPFIANITIRDRAGRLTGL